MAETNQTEALPVSAMGQAIWGTGVFFVLAALIAIGVYLEIDEDIFATIAVLSSIVGLVVLIIRFGVMSVSVGILLAWLCIVIAGVFWFG